MGEYTIFSASIGNGHNEASEALKNQFLANGEKAAVVDTFHSIHPLLHSLFFHAYLSMLRYQPGIWGELYKQSETRAYYRCLDHFATLFCRKLNAIITERGTGAIISTHPFVNAFLARLKDRAKLNIPFYTVITDLHLHPGHVRPEIDGYFIYPTPHEKFAEKYSVPADRFFPTGIPIKAIPGGSSKEDIRRSLGLDPEMKTILITGGGMGLCNYGGILTELEKMDTAVQILCLTGTNPRTADEVSSVKSKRHTIRVIPFTNRFMDYLRASDVVITKAGGLTLSEALACETPLIIFDPVPGHESCNAEMLTEAGAAVKAEQAAQIPNILNTLLHDGETYNAMAASASRLKRPDAAGEIVRVICGRQKEILQ
ncbi:MGDG synthase family glycosyltransferase [Alteribacter natronophilus]|uniref:MGDG synthase family glycosyltransferase n=1 Tax=Alteribacter natronophilus TaxID=2583810 RepID=UPI00110D9C52|nr:glycosyltransferase [Alteribacter natronophilus]TMW70958.1 glycosyltransferase [Alteribacter natronophilus]